MSAQIQDRPAIHILTTHACPAAVKTQPEVVVKLCQVPQFQCLHLEVCCTGQTRAAKGGAVTATAFKQVIVNPAGTVNQYDVLTCVEVLLLNVRTHRSVHSIDD